MQPYLTYRDHAPRQATPIHGLRIEFCPVSGCTHPIVVKDSQMGQGEGRANQALAAHLVHAHHSWVLNRGEVA